MLLAILLISIVVLLAAYRFYGNFLSKRCQSDDTNVTPACEVNDGVDYVPTRSFIVFGHHFSSIAGAGPIVGPILAATYFGWGPTWLWIILGSIFVGGVHDYGSTLMSLRFGGKTVSEITRSVVGKRTAQLFRIFLFLALVYVIVVFLDLTATTFSRAPEVATASGWFVGCAVVFGRAMMRQGIPFGVLLLVFVPLTFAGLAVGHYFPAPVWDKGIWVTLILGYCLIAAVLPVNLLLQPRDFLSSMFLVAMLLFGLIGLLFSGAEIQMPFFDGFTSDKINPGYLAPMLFITVACGACSGFHSMVASGTTSKQIRRESDTQRVAYGGMLVEGLLAVFALATVAVLATGEVAGNPVQNFSQGAAIFFGALGIPHKLGAEFAALTISTFLLTTLDTCTRLSRFLLEEFFEWRNQSSRYVGTILVLVPATLLVFQQFNGEPAYKALWPLFGSTNQLMAALALVTFIVFLKAKGLRYGFVVIPAIVMLLMPLSAMALMALDDEQTALIRIISLSMLLLGVFVTAMSLRFVGQHGSNAAQS